jgi:cytochrome c-type biogenesis protein CcmH/NrfG
MLQPVSCLAVFASAVLAQAPGTPATVGDDVASLITAADADYTARNEPGRLADARQKLARARELQPGDYQVLWRLARLDFWRSDDPALSKDEQSRLGKEAWQLGDEAAAKDPSHVEGHYFAAVGLGNYSLGIGVLKALTQGLEGKFKDRLAAAERIDPKYLDGGVFNAWGRFYYELPWPKYDARKSEQNLRRAVELNPADLRARVYLADLYRKEGNRAEAKKLLDAVLAAKPGAYDLPEELRCQQMARQRLPEIEK